MSNSILEIKKFNQEGDIAHEYNPLHNMVDKDNSVIDFKTTDLKIDLNHPVNIECQPSYDGTVNLILNNDKMPPRIINTRFTRLENNRFKIITRNQPQQTNLYRKDKVDEQTRLFRNLNNIPKVDLKSVNYYGQLKGGNYTFYFKFADNDYNKTDIVAETGQISIFKGNINTVSSISGTLEDELTEKSISLVLSNIDTTFSKVYVYFTRDTSDMVGFRKTSTYLILKPYEITNSTLELNINGFEDIEEINEEELNVKYNIVSAVKTQTQVQNMLFFGNTQGLDVNTKELQNISLFHKVTLRKANESIGWIDYSYNQSKKDDMQQTEYYNPLNIYYRLGYWPGEIYRLGIVYIFNDDSLSPVFNLRGTRFYDINDSNYDNTSRYNKLFDDNNQIQYVPQHEYIEEDGYLSNTKGVFRNPENAEIYNYESKEINPLFYEIELLDDALELLKKYNVKGYFIVRQKRIPITLAQGISVGVDKSSHTPCLNKDSKYISESFIDNNGVLTTDFNTRLINNGIKQTSGLISLDVCVNPLLQSIFDGSQFTLHRVNRGEIKNNGRLFSLENLKSDRTSVTNNIFKSNIIFINSDVPSKVVLNNTFSTRAGSPEIVKDFSFFGTRNFDKSNRSLLRGVFCPFLGLTTIVDDNCTYDIRVQNFSTVFEKEYFSIRGNDNSAFFAISNRYELSNNKIELYRGDCYTNTVTIRLHRNFIESTAPINEIIVDPNTWKNNYGGFSSTSAESWLNINRGDLNTVPIGTWLTFKVLSNYNLGLRSLDQTNVNEVAIMGNARSFYPLNSTSLAPSNKIEETWLLNNGYSSTVGQKRYVEALNVPYIKDLYDNRIMFSNVQTDDDFRNSYRVFQGLSYKDIDRQYGAIVKLIPWDVHLFCVFEHGLGIIPINEKALVQTTTGQNIHMKGVGVIQNQISLISSDFGSTWQDSIIKTPNGIYGIDTYAKKIWRYSTQSGLEILSDVKVQRYLNDNLKLSEKDKQPIIGLKNVKSHYNNYKGDIMFTFYNDNEDSQWNLCYNERINKWITRYSWVPLLSENVNNQFFSLDKKRAEVLSYIFDNKNTESGVNTSKNVWSKINNNYLDFETVLNVQGFKFYNNFKYVINNIRSSYLDENKVEHFINIDVNNINIVDNKLILSKNSLTYDKYNLYYFKINISITPISNNNNIELEGSTFTRNIGIVLDVNDLDSIQQKEYDMLIGNGFYVHGRAGIFDEINYFDLDDNNQIRPTLWYDKQEPFEIEFIVNNLTGMHKIFDNLVIISNNVEPENIEFEIIGDVYDFNKSGIYKQNVDPNGNHEWNKINNPRQVSQDFKDDVSIVYDHVLNQYSIVLNQYCKNINKIGRMQGNIQYKEGVWYSNINPIKFKRKNKKDGNIITDSSYTSTRIRDKFLKVRIKYSGKDIVTISAIKTLMTLSYS